MILLVDEDLSDELGHCEFAEKFALAGVMLECRYDLLERAGEQKVLA